jgi:hypothetical protein
VGLSANDITLKIAGLGSMKRVTERIFEIIQENKQKMLCA